MEAVGTGEEGEEPPKEARILGSELVESYTVYIIQVSVGSHQWTVKHRYSDFHDLHEKLVSEKKIDKNLLPPKKIIGKNSKSLVEKREKELEVYLQTLLVKFPIAAPKLLSHFLHFNLYEINGITAALAEELFHRGEQLLMAGEVFSLRPLQLYAITQQLRQGKPTCANGDAKTDLGHILDFTCRLKYLKVTGTEGPFGTSNIQEHLLPFDLSIFKSLHQIEINHCGANLIKGLTSSKHTLTTMSIRFSATSMKEILVPEASEFDQWEPEGALSSFPVTAVIPTWKTLTTLDMSHNRIFQIDDSVKLIPKIEFLELSHNDVSLVENLQHLYNLIHLDLSYNKLASLEGVHTKLGNIKTLNLAGNLLERLCGLNKLYSLVNLDLSSNKIDQIDEIRNIGSLPCLEKVVLSNNPLSIIPDYRTKVLAQFGDRASEVCLDNISTTEKELDTVEVLKAIQKAKEVKYKLNNSDKKISEDSRLTAANSKSNCSSLTVHPSSSSLPRPVSSSQDFWNQENSDCGNSSFHLSCCFVLKLNDLQSVNVGLFDQYFRITGHSADHIVTCLTRDSYSTHAFIQHLMAVLSLLARTPSPEPVDKDFYSEFGNKNTGKMENYELIHSSRVKFIYPNEEEIGDLAFLVAEKMYSLANLQSLNILLYVLAFQVNHTEETAQANSSLQPKTLILTSSDLFLFNEDYISYPLPEFAKEPPKKDKYQLTDGRRIRDLDRVLMGYQTYPQALTFVFDDVQNQDLMQNLTLDHFGDTFSAPKLNAKHKGSGNGEIQWYIFIPSAESREKLISLLARQWEILCGRELPLELTG
nr:nischarin isoform X4 [Chrysemys picta bellii]